MTGLDQTCPHCRIAEAAGAYCTKCIRPTQPDWIHPPKRSLAQDTTTRRLAASRSKETALGEVAA